MHAWFWLEPELLESASKAFKQTLFALATEYRHTHSFYVSHVGLSRSGTGGARPTVFLLLRLVNTLTYLLINSDRVNVDFNIAILFNIKLLKLQDRAILNGSIDIL